MDNDILIYTTSYVIARLSTLIAFGYALFRVLRPVTLADARRRYTERIARKLTDIVRAHRGTRRNRRSRGGGSDAFTHVLGLNGRAPA